MADILRTKYTELRKFVIRAQAQITGATFFLDLGQAGMVPTSVYYFVESFAVRGNIAGAAAGLEYFLAENIDPATNNVNELIAYIAGVKTGKVAPNQQDGEMLSPGTRFGVLILGAANNDLATVRIQISERIPQTCEVDFGFPEEDELSEDDELIGVGAGAMSEG